MSTVTADVPASHNGRWVKATFIVGETRKFIELRYSPRRVRWNIATTTDQAEASQAHRRLQPNDIAKRTRRREMPSEQPDKNPEQPKASVLLTWREIGEACLLWVKTNRPGIIGPGLCKMELHTHVDDTRTFARITEQ